MFGNTLGDTRCASVRGRSGRAGEDEALLLANLLRSRLHPHGADDPRPLQALRNDLHADK